MANLHEIKRRIDSTKKTSQITSAMQMVSTAKLNRSLQFTSQYQNYAGHVQEIIDHLVQHHLFESSESKANIPMLQERSVKKTGILVIASDRGLVGGYNANLLKELDHLLLENNLDTHNTAIYSSGSKGADYYRKREFEIALDYKGADDTPSFEQVATLVDQVISDYVDEKIDRLWIVYNHFVNRMTNEFHHTQILPITNDNFNLNAATEFNQAEYEFEPGETELLKAILPQFAQGLVYSAILDAKTAEHAASSQAMSTASDNASDVISSLTLKYNRARQSAITTEITEITAGTAALE